MSLYIYEKFCPINLIIDGYPITAAVWSTGSMFCIKMHQKDTHMALRFGLIGNCNEAQVRPMVRPILQSSFCFVCGSYYGLVPNPPQFVIGLAA